MKKIISAVFLLSIAGWTVFTFNNRNPEPAFQGKPITQWIQDLASSDYQLHRQAVEAIQAKGKSSVPYLIDGLQTEATFFRKIRVTLAQKIPFLPFNSVDCAVLREKSAEQLGALSCDQDAALKALVAALRDPNPDVLLEVQCALRRCGSASVPRLTLALRHRDARIRRGAAEVLVDLGPQAAPAIQSLTVALREKNEQVRCSAAKALGTIVRDQTSAIHALGNALLDSIPVVRTAAAEALGKIGSSSRAVLPQLMDRLRDQNTGVRIAAAKAVWLVSGQTETVVAVLIEALPDKQVGWQAPFILGGMGPHAHAAVPALIEALKLEKVPRPLRTPPSTALALGKIGAAAVPRLVETLQSEQPRVRTGAALALGFIGPEAKAAIPRLVELLSDQELEVRQAAALSLSSIRPETKELLPALKEMIRDDDIFLSSTAAFVLRKVDPVGAAELGLE